MTSAFTARATRIWIKPPKIYNPSEADGKIRPAA